MLTDTRSVGAGSSSPTGLGKIDGKLLFIANTDDNQYTLWVSDGTRDGTKMLKDVVHNDYYNYVFREVYLANRLLFSGA